MRIDIVVVGLIVVGLLGIVQGQADESECFGDVEQLINDCPRLTELEALRQVLLQRSTGIPEDPAFSLGCCTALTQLNDARCFCNQELIDVFTEATGEEEFLPSLLFQASQLTPAGCSIPIQATVGSTECQPFGNTQFPQEQDAQDTCTESLMSEVIMREPKLVFLQEALDLFELGPQIDSEGSLTIFAPSDEAFELWSTRQSLTVTDLLSSEIEFTTLIQKHIILDFVATSETVDEVGVTKNSQDGTPLQLQLESSGELLVQGVPTQPARTACNGVLYIVDQVLDGTEIPPERVVTEPTQVDETTTAETLPAPEIEATTVVLPETLPAPEVEATLSESMPQFLPASIRPQPITVEVVEEPLVEIEPTPVPTPTPTPPVSSSILPEPTTVEDVAEPLVEIEPTPVPTPTPVSSLEQPASVELPAPLSVTPLEPIPDTAAMEAVSTSLSGTQVGESVAVVPASVSAICEDNIFNIMSRFLPLFQEYLNIASESELQQFLETEEAITVLAPINTALLSKSQEELANWDPYNHIIIGSLALEDLEQLAGSTIQTVNGEVEATLGAEGQLLVGGIEFIQTDVQGCNGQLHVLGDLIYNDQIIGGPVPSTGGAFEVDGVVADPVPEPVPVPGTGGVFEVDGVVADPVPEPVPVPGTGGAFEADGLVVDPVPSPSPEPSPSPLPSPSPKPVSIPRGVQAPLGGPGVVQAMASREPSPSPLPSPSPEPVPIPSAELVLEVVPSPIIVPSPEIIPSPVPTPTPTPTPTPKPVQVPSPALVDTIPESVSEDPTSPLGGELSCGCSESGVSGGIDTGRPGCATHVPNWPAFCYVVDPAECSLARPSGRYPGARYRNCTIGGDNSDIEEAATVSEVKLSVDTNACTCTQSGISGGVQTGRVGCKNHIPGNDKFCYVVNPRKCDIDTASNKFEGAGYRACSVTSDVVVSQQQATFQQVTNDATGESSVQISWQGNSS